jgi:hypothetical protein
MHVPFSDVNFAVFSNCPMFKSLIIPRWLSVFWNIQYGEHFVTKLKIHTPLCFCSAVGQYTHSLSPHSLSLFIVSVHIDLVNATTHSVYETILGYLTETKVRQPWTVQAGQRSTKNILYFLHSLQQQMYSALTKSTQNYQSFDISDTST